MRLENIPANELLALLEKHLEAEHWKCAEQIASRISQICFQNDRIVNPPVCLRCALPKSERPATRIYSVLSRLSRNRIIEINEQNVLVLRMAKKWSGMPTNTINSLWRNPRTVSGRWWKGEFRVDAIWGYLYEELEEEARTNGWKFSRLATRRKTQQRKLSLKIDKVEDTKRFINRIKKELNDVRKNQQYRPAA